MNRLCGVYFVMCLFHNVTALLNKTYYNIPVIQTENENYCITVCMVTRFSYSGEIHIHLEINFPVASSDNLLI